jgi:hypothetical protein
MGATRCEWASRWAKPTAACTNCLDQRGSKAPTARVPICEPTRPQPRANLHALWIICRSQKPLREPREVRERGPFPLPLRILPISAAHPFSPWGTCGASSPQPKDHGKQWQSLGQSGFPLPEARTVDHSRVRREGAVERRARQVVVVANADPDRSGAVPRTTGFCYVRSFPLVRGRRRS